MVKTGYAAGTACDDDDFVWSQDTAEQSEKRHPIDRIRKIAAGLLTDETPQMTEQAKINISPF